MADFPATLSSAVRLQRAGLLGDAATLYAEVLAANPTNVAALSNLGVLRAVQGDFNAAASHYRSVLKLSPKDADTLSNLGRLYHARAKLADAEACFREALAHDPGHAVACSNLGQVLEETGRVDEALEVFREAVRRHPNDPDALILLGDCCANAGSTAEAEQWYRKLIDLQPKSAAAWFRLGTALASGGNTVDALRAHQRAAHFDPDFAPAWREAGYFLYMAGRLDEAEESLECALALAPEDGKTNLHLGMVWYGRDHFKRAMEFFDRARILVPDLFEAQFNAALCLHRLGRVNGAISAMVGVTQAFPGQALVHKTLGDIYRCAGQNEEAVASGEAAGRIDPEDPEIWIGLARAKLALAENDAALLYCERALALDSGKSEATMLYIQVLAELGRKKEAIEAALAQITGPLGESEDTLHALARVCHFCGATEAALRAYRLVVALAPDNADAVAKSTVITLDLCDWRDYDALVAATGSWVKDAIANHTSLGYCVQDLHNFSVPSEILAKASNLQGDLVAAEVRGLENFPAFSHGEKIDRWRRGERWRLRVGYALPYTWQHSFPMMMNQFIEFHDRQQFEIFGYCAHPSRGTEFEDEYRSKFDHFRDFPEGSPVEAGRMVHDDGIDVLIDVTGHSSINCQEVMVTRPAPVQVEAMGFSLPVGGEYIDYLLTQRDFIGEEFAQYCDETLVYMPDTLFPAYRPPTSAVKIMRSDLQLPETGFVFANFNQSFKFDPVMFSVWMQILKRVEGSVLWLGTWLEGTTKNLRREAEAHGVDPHRLVFGVIAKHEQHMARIAHAGLLLDNRLHGGGATTMDFLWAGVPLVTCPAHLPVSRNGAMLANALGMPEMVTDSLESYAEFAVGVGNDPGRHRALCEKVKRCQTTQPLFDQQRFARHFETAIQSMWKQSVFGGTGAITVPPLDAQPEAAAE